MTCVHRHQRPTYIGTNDLRSTTTRREGLFGGSIHTVWRLQADFFYSVHCFCIGFYYLCTIKQQKCMAKNLLNKYVWLVDTIYKAKQITFEKT